MFKVYFSSCDGAGSYPDTFETLDEAARFADSKQATSDERGNPYGYAYCVMQSRRYDGPVYQAPSTTIRFH